MKGIATIARYTLLEALRGRVIALVLVLALLGFLFSIFLQQVAITESRQIQSGTLAAIYRLGSVAILVSFVVSGMLRDYHDKSMEFLLAMPIGRSSYLFGKTLGYAACSLIFAIALSLPLLWGNASSQVLLWGISLFLELLLMGSVSLFFSVTMTQVPSALAAVFGFYFLSRIMGILVLIVNGPIAEHGWAQKIAGGMLWAIGFFLPRLDEFTRTAWLVYPGASWQELQPVLFQSAIYLILMSGAALYDFSRRSL